MAGTAAPCLLSNFFGLPLSLLRNGDSRGPLLPWGVVSTQGVDVQTVIQWHEKSPQQMASAMVPMETVLPVTVLVGDLSLFPVLELGVHGGLWVTCRSPRIPGGLQP